MVVYIIYLITDYISFNREAARTAAAYQIAEETVRNKDCNSYRKLDVVSKYI